MRERQLFSGPLFDIAEFACPPQDEAWRDVNVIESASPLVVFPHTTVGIHPGGARPCSRRRTSSCSTTRAQEYERDAARRARRRVPLRRAARAGARGARGRGRRHPRRTDDARRTRRPTASRISTSTCSRGTCDGAAARRAARRGDDDAARALRRPTRWRRAGATPRDDGGSHVALDGGREGAARGDRSPSRSACTSVAARLGVSPFHLARVFRARDGLLAPPVPHAAAPAARARAAAGRARGALTSLAFELGFASHSHFTDTFRREFGVAPSAVRDDAQVRRAARRAERARIRKLLAFGAGLRSVPCADDLDFWVGEWDARWDGGHGTNTVTSELDGAVILERFDGRPGTTLRGLSVSVFDARADAGARRGSTRRAATSTSPAASATTASWSSATRSATTARRAVPDALRRRRARRRSPGSGSARDGEGAWERAVADRSTRAAPDGARWPGVEIRLLVCAAGRRAEGSFSLAARQLGYTQSAVSGQILALERAVGARLSTASAARAPSS